MAVKVGINGFGRIGRNFFRSAVGNKDVVIVGINDLSDAKTLAHLLKYDSNYGILDADVSVDGDCIVVDGHKVKVCAEKDPANLPWGALGADVVIESTGIFRKKEQAMAHVKAGAKKVIISAPSPDPDVTIVLGVNEKEYDPKAHTVLSNASCTTNCLAPVAKVILDNFGIVTGIMTTIHAYTNDQKILDLQSKDLRRARAAALSIIPTSTGAAQAVALVLPQVKGKFTGYALRVPTSTVSVVDLSVITEKAVTAESVNAAIKAAAEGPMKNILQYTDEELVSVDFKGNRHSSIFDSLLTTVVGENHLKVVSWYDNEMGYSNRLVDLCALIGKSL